MAGFECSTHRTATGRRLDVVAASGHDRWADQDYARLREAGFLAAREGLRWHLIEARPGRYDFSSAEAIRKAARAHGVQVIWDLCHYGWPDWLDVWKADFVRHFADLAAAFTEWHDDGTGDPFVITPVNEISFLSWAAGEMGYFHPYGKGRGGELKRQLVRASIAASDAAWSVRLDTRVLITDPVVNVLPHPLRPQDAAAAEAYRQAQFEAADMLAGLVQPELGGAPRYVDLVGLNYYHDNQWYFGSGRKLARDHPRYRPLHEMLAEWWDRYRRPLLLAETGIEDRARPDWLRWVGSQVDTALASGVPVLGICLYPILNHPGWLDDRHCHNGLWDYPDAAGGREIYEPLARELRRQQKRRSRG